MSALGRRLTCKTPRRWRLLKKRFPRPRDGNPRGTRARHIGRGLVPGRDARWPEEQTHLSLGQDGLTSTSRSRSTHPIGLSVRCGMPRTRNRGRPRAACNTEAMQLHLDEIATKVAPNAHAILLLDQAGWHGAKALQVPQNISLLPLPPRSPELNPQENIWQFMRQNWLSNRIFKSFDDILDPAATPGIPSSPNHGKSSPSLVATGQTSVRHCEDWYKSSRFDGLRHRSGDLPTSHRPDCS